MGRARLVLYLRCRGVAPIASGLAVLLVATGWNGASLGWVLPDVVLVFIAVLAAVFLAGSFATPSPELDATASLPWWRWRLGHALLGLTICVVPLAVTVAFHRRGDLGLDLTIVRNVLGFGGLALLTAALTGAWLSWTTPFTYALVAWVFSSATSSWARVWLWPVLPPNTALSWWPALTLCTIGTILITTRGTAARQRH